MLTREHFRLSGFQNASPAYEVDALVDPDQVQLTIPRGIADDLGLQSYGAIRLERLDCESCVSTLVKVDEVVMGWLPLSSLVKVINMPSVYSDQEAAAR
jgi:hypothetical protein